MKFFIEVSTSRLDGTRCTYIQLGFPTDKPTVIWKKYETQQEFRKTQLPSAAVPLVEKLGEGLLLSMNGS
jgi:hypothetical protein